MIGKDLDGYNEYAEKSVVYTVSTKPSTGDEDLDAFAGTWSGKIGTATWTIVIDGKGNFTANGTAYHYTVDSETKASSVEADGSDKLFVFTLKGNTLSVERYDADMMETYTGTLTKQA